MTFRFASLTAALVLLAAPALAGDANESSEITIYPVPATAEAALPQSTVTDTEALALPEPEMDAAAPVSGCRRHSAETVYLTN